MIQKIYLSPRLPPPPFHFPLPSSPTSLLRHHPTSFLIFSSIQNMGSRREQDNDDKSQKNKKNRSSTKVRKVRTPPRRLPQPHRCRQQFVPRKAISSFRRGSQVRGNVEPPPYVLPPSVHQVSRNEYNEAVLLATLLLAWRMAVIAHVSVSSTVLGIILVQRGASSSNGRSESMKGGTQTRVPTVDSTGAPVSKTKNRTDPPSPTHLPHGIYSSSHPFNAGEDIHHESRSTIHPPLRRKDSNEISNRSEGTHLKTRKRPSNDVCMSDAVASDGGSVGDNQSTDSIHDSKSGGSGQHDAKRRRKSPKSEHPNDEDKS